MTYNFPCSPSCLCFPCCTLGIALPLFRCLCCVCERSKDNTWITRDNKGIKTGEVIIVDHERGTLAMHGAKCCSSELDAHPQCYCEKILTGARLEFVSLSLASVNDCTRECADVYAE